MLIGIYGKARSGKDTVANHLFHEWGFVKYSFANPLKSIVAELFDMTNEQMNGDLKEVVDERYGKSPRWLLQHIGTDVFRALYENVWSDLGIRRYNNAKKEHGPDIRMVIPDVRFPNEMEAIKVAGGYIWKTVRPDHEGAKTGIANHPSEVSLDGLPDSAFDSVLSAASGQIPLLLQKAETAVEKILAEHGILKGAGHGRPL